MLRGFGDSPEGLISDSERAWRLICDDIAFRRHQLLACEESNAELPDARGDATRFLSE
jgi:hypothetical protein